MNEQKSKSYLGKLLHLADPTLPIGAYTQSNGLETYVQQRLVHNSQTAEEYIRHNLWYNIKYNDAALMYYAYKAMQNNDLKLLEELDQECDALKSAREVREGSQKLGVRLFKIFARYIKDEQMNKWAQEIKEKNIVSHYCITYGIFAQRLGIPVEEALHGYLYNAAIGMVTNAVKLVPLGQLDGQDILFHLHDELEDLVEEIKLIDRDLVGLCNVGFDIRCMQHERLYTRIYIS